MKKQNTGKAVQHSTQTEPKQRTKPEWQAAVIAAACIMGGFAFLAYLLPPIMLWLGKYSLIAAAAFAILFVLAFFGVFWMRARSQKNNASNHNTH